MNDRTRRRWLAPALLVGFAAVLAAATFLALAPAKVDPLNGAQVDLGKRLYGEACASCHGASLEGQPNWQRRLPNGRLPAPPHDVSGHTWHHSDDVLFRITKDGPMAYPKGYQTDMPAFALRLTDKEIAATLAFIKSTWPPEIRERQQRISAGSDRRKP